MQPAADNPAVTTVRRDLASCCNNLGALYSQVGPRAEALKAYERARILLETLSAGHPGVSELRSQLARYGLPIRGAHLAFQAGYSFSSSGAGQ